MVVVDEEAPRGNCSVRYHCCQHKIDGANSQCKSLWVWPVLVRPTVTTRGQVWRLTAIGSDVALKNQQYESCYAQTHELALHVVHRTDKALLSSPLQCTLHIVHDLQAWPTEGLLSAGKLAPITSSAQRASCLPSQIQEKRPERRRAQVL